MDYPIKSSVITNFLSQTTDRFHVYNEKKTLEERFQMASAIEGMSGVEVVYPYEVPDAAALKAAAGQVPPRGVGGQLQRQERAGVPQRRAHVQRPLGPRQGGALYQGIQRLRGQRSGPTRSPAAPSADGYEFSFGCNYRTAWKRLVETFGEAAAHRPEIPLFVEYKPSETRGRCFVDNAAKTLCLLNDIGNARMGVTLDFGHSMYGHENPAEALSLLAASRFPYYIHINDNDARWDWDFMVGTKHLLDYIEFLYYLQEFGYKDFITSDTSPTRWDIKGTFAQNVRLTNKLWSLLAGLNRKELARLVERGDYIETWKFIEKEVFKL